MRSPPVWASFVVDEDAVKVQHNGPLPLVVEVGLPLLEPLNGNMHPVRQNASCGCVPHPVRQNASCGCVPGCIQALYQQPGFPNFINGVYEPRDRARVTMPTEADFHHPCPEDIPADSASPLAGRASQS